MENEKYFTPDIRVGYECEMSSDGFEFFKTIIDITDISDLIEWYKCGYLNFDDLSEVIRVPYLSKGDIEVEGWKLNDDKLLTLDNKQLYSFSKNNFGLLFQPYNNDIQIYDKRREIYVYQGECKCINTFRYLNKLLNI